MHRPFFTSVSSLKLALHQLSIYYASSLTLLCITLKLTMHRFIMAMHQFSLFFYASLFYYVMHPHLIDYVSPKAHRCIMFFRFPMHPPAHFPMLHISLKCQSLCIICIILLCYANALFLLCIFTKSHCTVFLFQILIKIYFYLYLMI